MKRLTNEEVRVDESVDGMIGPLVDLTNMKPKLLDMILNGPTLNGISKDTLRSIIRQLYSALAACEDTGLEPEEVDKLTKDWSDLCTVSESAAVSMHCESWPRPTRTIGWWCVRARWGTRYSECSPEKS